MIEDEVHYRTETKALITIDYLSIQPLRIAGYKRIVLKNMSSGSWIACS